MQVGVVPTPEIFGPQDFYFRVPLSVAYLANTTTPVTVGSFVMPFTGSLVADLHFRGSIGPGGNNYCRVHLATSSPAPDAYSYHGCWPRSTATQTTREELPVTAIWNSVAKNTTVTVVGSVIIGPSSAVNGIQVGGFIHAWQ